MKCKKGDEVTFRSLLKSPLVNKGLNAKFIILPIFIIILGLVVRFYHISYPFISTQDTGFIPTFSKNMLNNGMSKSHFLPVRNINEATDTTKHVQYHINHPSLTHVGLSLSYKLFGIGERVYRIFNILSGGLILAISLYLLLSYKINKIVGIWALLFWSIIPSGVYFERLFSMTMQSLAWMVAFLYLFFKYNDDKKVSTLILALLSIVCGALSDWHFQFIFPFLIAYCAINKKNLKSSIFFTIISALVLGAYLVYSQNIASGGGLTSSVTRDWWEYIQYKVEFQRGWWEYIRHKVEFQKVFTIEYFLRVKRLYLLHFTETAPVIVIIGMIIIGKKTIIDNKKQYISIPALLIAPGVFYLLTVPHNTMGHIWTLYMFLPGMAFLFGITNYTLFKKESSYLFKIVGIILIVAVMSMSIKTTLNLHQISDYHAANSRVGQLVSNIADRTQTVLVDNYDTVSFYINGPTKELISRDRITDTFLREKNYKKPSVVIFNQGGSLDPVSANTNLLKYADVTKVLGAQGYHLWLNNPLLAWTNLNTENLFLLCDQHINREIAGINQKSKINYCYIICRNNILKGFVQEMTENQENTIVFRDVPINQSVDVIKFSLLSFNKPTPKGVVSMITTQINMELDKDIVLIGEEEIAVSRKPKHFSYNIKKYQGKIVNIMLTSMTNSKEARDIRIVWGEPRLEKNGTKFIKEFVVNENPDIYLYRNWNYIQLN